MIAAWIGDSASVIRAIVIGGSAYVVLTSGEYLVANRRLTDKDIVGSEVLRARWLFSLPVLSRLRPLLLDDRWFQRLIKIRLVAGALLGALAVAGYQVPALIGLVFALSVLFGIRNPYGLDGAHQLSLIIFGGLLLASVFPVGSLAHQLSVLFIAAQAVLAYLLSGLSKLSSPTWREGRALTGILGTNMYGHKWFHERLVQYPRLDTLGCWSVMLFECSFPLVLLIDLQYGILLLLGGLVFHLSTAVLMGLNGFVLAFASTYPAIAYANVYLQGLL